MKDETIALGNAILPIPSDGMGLYSWDMVANSFCGDAETARLFALDRAALDAGVTIERIIDCLHVDDREHVAKSLYTAISDGKLCRESFRVRAGRGAYRHVLTVSRCFGYSDGLPTTCSGFVYDMQPRPPRATPLPLNRTNVVPFVALR